MESFYSVVDDRGDKGEQLSAVERQMPVKVFQRSKEVEPDSTAKK